MIKMRPIRKLFPRHFAIWSSLLLICGLNLSGCQMGTTDAATRGKELFETCVPCHQQDGSGYPAVGAPNIAGMNDWYVQLQLENFRAGSRGTHFNDVEGMRMRAMSLSLPSEEDVKAVAHYVGTMPPVRHAPSVRGDPQAGKEVYAICQTCHGEYGAGNQAVAAPRIAGVDDWYVATELRKFNSGVRGSNPKDRQGRSMRAVSRGALPDDDAIRNVVAYIATLKP